MLKKFFKTIAVVLLCLVTIWVIKNWVYLRAFPGILSSYYAKEYCSCYFLVGNTEKYCHQYTKQFVPIGDFRLDTEKKRVTVSALLQTNSAKFIDRRYGCQLEQ